MTIEQPDRLLTSPTSAIRAYLQKSISIADILNQIWPGRWIILGTTVLGVFYGAYEAHKAGPLFLASMSVMPASTDEGGTSGAVGVLTSLAGGSSTTPVPKFKQFLASLGSVSVATRLDQKYDMVCTTNRGWCDPETHQWQERTGIMSAFATLLARIGGLPDPNKEQTVVDLAAYNKAAIAIANDKEGDLTILSYSHRDPKIAADYLSKVVNTTNDYIREQDRTTQRRYVNYVTRRIADNTNVEQRTVLDSLLLQQERKLMMTEVDVPYAASILDGPTVTPLNTVLKRILTDALGGLLLGIAVMLFRNLVPERFRLWRKA